MVTAAPSLPDLTPGPSPVPHAAPSMTLPVTPLGQLYGSSHLTHETTEGHRGTGQK